jgi:hypothetical protein
MMRTQPARYEALAAVVARPCARMRGFGWRLVKQGFNAIGSTGDTTTARRLLGAPT